jgi:nucleoside-diphosphate-sugar epimerase
LRWLILGSGFVGAALQTHLAEAGEQVEVDHAPRLTAAVESDEHALAESAVGHPAAAALAAGLADRGEIDCVVLAAGLATPDSPQTPELIGANALLPGVVLQAARLAGVRRFVHLSSAAVQGRRRVLTETTDTQPFSAYSSSKALGERVIKQLGTDGTEAIIIRATSVQGPGRATTASLQRIARSRLSSVAGTGTQPSAVSSVGTLCEFVRRVGGWPEPVPSVVLQPWEGLSVRDVLSAAGGREPRRLPRWLCQGAVSGGYVASRLVGRPLDGPVRRVEAMWFGQAVEAGWAERAGLADNLRQKSALREILRAAS